MPRVVVVYTLILMSAGDILLLAFADFRLIDGFLDLPRLSSEESDILC